MSGWWVALVIIFAGVVIDSLFSASWALDDGLLLGQCAGMSPEPGLPVPAAAVPFSALIQVPMNEGMGTNGAPRTAPRVWLAPLCLIVAPILGVWAGGSMPNPPGDGPGSGQVFVGAVVPLCVALTGSVLARIRAVEVAVWALASVALTGGLILFLMYFVEHVLRPA